MYRRGAGASRVNGSEMQTGGRERWDGAKPCEPTSPRAALTTLCMQE